MEFSQRIFVELILWSELLAFSFLSWHSRRNNKKKKTASRRTNKSEKKSFLINVVSKGKDERNVWVGFWADYENLLWEIDWELDGKFF
jgi:hypothetical protein